MSKEIIKPTPEQAAKLHKCKELPLTELLQLLRVYGSPSIMFYETGWRCSVDMHIATKGSSFTVSSDFRMACPHGAAIQCAERILATINYFK